MNWFAVGTSLLYLGAAGLDLYRGQYTIALIWIGYALSGFALAWTVVKH